MFSDDVKREWPARYGYRPSENVLTVLRLLDRYMAAGGTLDDVEKMLDSCGGCVV